MIVSSQQPILLPWVGFWAKMIASDVLVLSAGNVFTRSDYEHRVKLYDSWVTLPLSKETTNNSIHDVIVKDAKKLAQRIERECCVKKNKYHHRLNDILTLLEKVSDMSLGVLNLRLICILKNELRIPTEVVYDHGPHEGVTKTIRLKTRLERNVGPNFIYYAGAGASDYLNVAELGHTCLIQVIPKEFSTDSIVHLIANVEYPVEYISNFGGWEYHD